MRLTVPTLGLLLAILNAPVRAELSGLSESDLSAVAGQQGILLSLNLRNNVTGSLAPIGCTAVTGAPNSCRMGLEFAARAGTWLMLKEFYGTLQIKDLRIDIGFMPATATAYANPARFDANGSASCTNPLLPSCSPASRPALTLTYPGIDSTGTYDDMLSFLNIGRVWLEFDTAGTPVTPGYARDTSLNSAFGMRMSDSRALNEPAHIRLLGTAYVYGF